MYCYVLEWWDIRFGQDCESARSISKGAQADLRSICFVINDSKSLWNPIQSLDWLGNSIDTVKFVLKVPARRLKKVQETGLEIISVVKRKHETVPVRKVASFVGQVKSMSSSTVIGLICQLMTRCLSIDILNAHSRNAYIRFSEESIKQIQFWIDNIHCINVRNLSIYPSCDKKDYSHTSGHWFRGYCVESRHV